MQDETKLREEFELIKPSFILKVFQSFQKHLGKRADTCRDCGGAMYTMCEKAMREMYAQGMDKTGDWFISHISQSYVSKERI